MAPTTPRRPPWRRCGGPYTCPSTSTASTHPEPGGLSTRDVVRLLHRIRAPIAGADLVEYNPALDTRDLTARVAAKLLKELLAVALRNART